MRRFLGDSHDEDDPALAAYERVMAFDIRCPGRAHADGEACAICDVERDGMVEVLLTYVERDALCCAARGLPFDRCLLPRLVKLGLLERASGGRCIPTATGRAIIAAHREALC